MNFNGPIIYNVERGGKVKGCIELLFFGNVYHAARRRLSGRYWWPCRTLQTLYQGLKSVVSVLLHSYLQSIYPRSCFVYVLRRIIQTENFSAKLFHKKTFQTTRALSPHGTWYLTFHGYLTCMAYHLAYYGVYVRWYAIYVRWYAIICKMIRNNMQDDNHSMQDDNRSMQDDMPYM